MSSRKISLIIVLATIVLGAFVYPSGFNNISKKVNQYAGIEAKSYAIPQIPDILPFRLGLDLVGGAHLEYQADLSTVTGQTADEAMSGVRDVIERRVNVFGVAEPLVQIQGRDRLIVELAGINNVKEAIDSIGQTPLLEFRVEKSEEEKKQNAPQAVPVIDGQALASAQNSIELQNLLSLYTDFKQTNLSGKNLKKSQVVFDPTTRTAQVSIDFDDEGAKIFGELTRSAIGRRIAIYLDGNVISAPTVQNEITNGSAVITGRFTPEEAKQLATRLNAGALPVKINLISQSTVGASLGQESLNASLTAGLYGLLFVALFMIVYYRLPGLVSVVALITYTTIVLFIYKLIPVTLTLSGIAGFILSLGIAVDANVLIFARMREELKAGRTVGQAIAEGFRRAWSSIRDGHVTTLIGALILYIFTSSIVKGFALTLGIGVLTSLFTATFVSRIFLRSIEGKWLDRFKFLV